MRLSIIDFIDVDIDNGHVNESDGSLLFFVDGVSCIKTETSLLIDIHYSLIKRLKIYLR